MPSGITDLGLAESGGEQLLRSHPQGCCDPPGGCRPRSTVSTKKLRDESLRCVCPRCQGMLRKAVHVHQVPQAIRIMKLHRFHP
jgi:hypothetical protein